ncbi:Bug family tripartite tricarboxylate transporter substrate binding protein [Falsiroseomonas tokyonensis]|uniref:Bug family tripartite tricarboxylate transporter substrate binding protein n=1 Tax=Falsiroseomonas tokyonensis TaxID=430521 RepID=A0ABV7BQN5_9PROT|nr:tripartite tricarboxylate transporter substrate binding protein [Falsiroseomonas tokyonensis]MBU8537331.1 tripartite tricarboxylate transporter substrate binding protein [Falsiroseomonas tokyonensis]
MTKVDATRRGLLGLAAGLAAGLATGGAFAQGGWPARVIRLVIPFSAGTTVDLLGRVLAAGLARELGQAVVVENRGGAGGNLGSAHVARALADGHTLLLGTIGTHGVNASLYADQGFNPVADFVPVAPFAATSSLLAVPPGLGVTDATALIALGRRRGAPLTFASTGQGTTAHLSMLLFAKVTGVTVQHIPYQSPTQAIADLLQGRMDAMFYSPAVLGPHLRSGALRALAVTAPERLPSLPEVPTTTEAGLPGLVVQAWCGLYAPTGTPGDVLARLVPTMRVLGTDAGLVAALARLGAQPMPGGAEDLARLTREEVARWRGLVDRAAD